jgi:hypothetical protein
VIVGMGNRPSAAELKLRHRAIRGSQPDELSTRIHRAISWLRRAEREADDPDAAFIFLWISLNAAYASEFGFEQAERDQVRQFISTLLEEDRERSLHAILFEQFSGSIRTLIENRFVFEPFWKALRDHDSSGRWETQFAKSRAIAMRAVIAKETDLLLSIVLDRLYVLRNQLVHGGSTWAGSVNRNQVHDGAAILASVMPEIIVLMMRSDGSKLGKVAYPVIPT